MIWFGSRVENEQEFDLKAIWKTYAYWAGWVGIAFFSIYPACNWITAQREHLYHIYFRAELGIPFVPEFFWIYISMYLLFLFPPLFLTVSQLQKLGKRIVLGTVISGVIFLLFPSELGFVRSVPEGFYGALFAQMFALDLPHNMVPSLHIVYSGLIILTIYRASAILWVRIGAIVWLGLIAFSTLLVHQHHSADIIVALIVIWFSVTIQIRILEQSPKILS
jgi:hypothetical protein